MYIYDEKSTRPLFTTSILLHSMFRPDLVPAQFLSVKNESFHPSTYACERLCSCPRRGHSRAVSAASTKSWSSPRTSCCQWKRGDGAERSPPPPVVLLNNSSVHSGFWTVVMLQVINVQKGHEAKSSLSLFG